MTRICGTGAWLPQRTVTNHDLVATGLDTSHQWIVDHTGIHARRIASESDATSDLAVRAAEQAISSSGIDRLRISSLICATSTPDYPLPATANIVQSQLGLECGAVDLNGGCSGFVLALVHGFALQKLDPQSHVLVVGADTYSRILNWEDRGSAIFFGDGAGAVLLGPGAPETQLLSWVAGSDGARAEAIYVPAGGARQPATVQTVEDKTTRFKMQGRAVWDFAVDQVPRAVRAVVERAGLSIDDVDCLIPHQSNARMLEAIAEQLGLPRHKLFTNVAGYANTAAASVGIALHEAAPTLRPGANVVLVGFGAGLSWCAACLRW